MKLAEAVEQVKREKPHSFSMDHCTLFISEVEQAVQEYLGIRAQKIQMGRGWQKGTDRSGAVQRALHIISEGKDRLCERRV